MPIPAWRRAAGAAALVAAVVAAASPDEPAPVVRAKFTCDAGRTIDAEFVDAPQPRVRLTLSDGRTLTLPQAVSASGARYADAGERIVFWNKGDTAFLDEAGRSTYTGCVAGR